MVWQNWMIIPAEFLLFGIVYLITSVVYPPIMRRKHGDIVSELAIIFRSEDEDAGRHREV